MSYGFHFSKQSSIHLGHIYKYILKNVYMFSSKGTDHFFKTYDLSQVQEEEEEEEEEG